MRKSPEGSGNDGAGLVLRGIEKAFDGLPVLRGIDLDVRPGEFVTLLGPSGCGKTTLIRIVAGLALPDAGAVQLGGRDLGGLPAHRRPVNTVFQSYALFPHLTAYENVAFGLRSRGVPPAETARRVAATLALLRLDGLAARFAHQLSGGQKQRVALARALVNEPELLLLDEPMSALDAKLRGELQLELRQLQRRLGTMFVLVTHDQDEAMAVSDRIFVMNDGRIEQGGAPEEVYERPVNRFVASFLGKANLIPARANGTHLVETPLGPLRLREPPPFDEGTLHIRPERIVLADEPPVTNGMRVTVTEVVYRGDHAEVLAEPGPLRIRVPAPAATGIGTKAWATLDPAHLEALGD